MVNFLTPEIRTTTIDGKKEENWKLVTLQSRPYLAVIVKAVATWCVTIVMWKMLVQFPQAAKVEILFIQRQIYNKHFK